MPALRLLFAYIAGLAAAVLASAGAYTAQVVGQHQSVGASYSGAQIIEAVLSNAANTVLGHPPLLGLLLSLGLGLGFLIAAGVRWAAPALRRLPGLLVYAAAGALAVMTAIYAAETAVAVQFGGMKSAFDGRIDVIGGASSPIGLALQGAAGAVGGLVFSLCAPRRSPHA